MIFAALLFTAGWIMLILCPHPTTPWDGLVSKDPKAATISALLLAGRAITGLGIGLVCCSVSTYLNEIAPKQIRGAVGTVFQVGVVVGIFLA